MVHFGSPMPLFSPTLLETQRLLLRRPWTSDQPHLERIFCDAKMMRYLGSPWTAAQTAEVLAEWHADWGVEHRWTGILVLKDPLTPIGTAGITENTIADEEGCELSWFVLPEYQHQSCASEITRALLRFAFETLGAPRALAETHPDNPAANRLLEKLGFTCLGERHHAYDDLPGFDTQVLWRMTREECHSQINQKEIQKETCYE